MQSLETTPISPLVDSEWNEYIRKLGAVNSLHATRSILSTSAQEGDARAASLLQSLDDLIPLVTDWCHNKPTEG